MCCHCSTGELIHNSWSTGQSVQIHPKQGVNIGRLTLLLLKLIPVIGRKVVLIKNPRFCFSGGDRSKLAVNNGDTVLNKSQFRVHFKRVMILLEGNVHSSQKEEKDSKDMHVDWECIDLERLFGQRLDIDLSLFNCSSPFLFAVSIFFLFLLSFFDHISSHASNTKIFLFRRIRPVGRLVIGCGSCFRGFFWFRFCFFFLFNFHGSGRSVLLGSSRASVRRFWFIKGGSSVFLFFRCRGSSSRLLLVTPVSSRPNTSRLGFRSRFFVFGQSLLATHHAHALVGLFQDAFASGFGLRPSGLGRGNIVDWF
mmetsp:Transcript_128785/g.372620  ORF Transcript_128785/g.372620 Transcript_128785/m.372620 type:complete len:309 (+) Transcript_128785:627-1553(+)